jgi:hypothetical protein
MSEYISRLQEAIASSIRGMSREDLLWRPEGKWSTAEVLEHLYLTYTGTVKGCERSLTAEDPLITSQTSKQRFKTLVVVTLGYFPPGLQAPAQVHPKGTPVEQLVSDIAQQITVMDELLTRCELRHGKHEKLFNHPVLGALTGTQWRKFHWIHGRHHMQQILELRKKYSNKEKPSIRRGLD